MNLVPRRDFLHRLVPSQCFQCYLRLELPAEPGRVVIASPSFCWWKTSLVPCLIFWDHPKP